MRDGLRGHPLLFLDRQEAGLEHHRRPDQRALKLGEIPTPFVSNSPNLGSYLGLENPSLALRNGIRVKVAAMTATTHNPSEEPCWVSRLRENFTSGSYGEELETGPAARSGTAPVPYPTNHVRQSQDQGLRAGGHAPDRPRQTLHLARAARLRRGAHRQNRRRHRALASHSCQKPWSPRALAVRSRPPHAAKNLCRRKS